MIEDLNPNTDIVVPPHVSAGVVDLSVPLEELGKGDAIFRL